MKKLFVTLFILSPLLILYACGSSYHYDIVVSDYFTYDIVKQVTGDELTIKTLQPIHMDYHTYEPSSSDLVDLKKSDVFIYTSINASPWLVSENNVSSVIGDGAFTSFEVLLNLEVTHDEETWHDHEEDMHDDHDHGFDFISNPFYVATIVQNLSDYLGELYPELKQVFDENAHDYYDKLTNLITPYHDSREALVPLDVYFIGHNALNGFSEAFNLNIIALDENVSPNTEATSAQVLAFVSALKNNGITTMYMEETPDQTTVNYIKAQIPNIEILELHTFHKISKEDYKNNIGYYELIERNINHLEMAN